MILDSFIGLGVNITSEQLVHTYTFTENQLIRLYVTLADCDNTASNATLRIALWDTVSGTEIIPSLFYQVYAKPRATDTSNSISCEIPILLAYDTIIQLGVTPQIKIYITSDNGNDTSASVIGTIIDSYYTSSEDNVTAIKAVTDTLTTQAADTVKVLAAVYDDNTVDEDGIVTLSNGVEKQITTSGRTTVE